VRSHDLIHEFPEHRERIHELKSSDNHFRKLFDEYCELTTEIENMEKESAVVSTRTEEEARKRRLHLKDEFYRMLQA